jgi:peptidylprolyl isomerase
MAAKNADKVKIHYRGTLDDGTLFDESYEGEPLEFTIGEGMVIPGFEKGIIGMDIGEKKQIHIPTTEAYGNRSEDLIIEFPMDSIPDDLKIEVGDLLQLQLAPEQVVDVVVIEIKEESVVFDANHRLADQDLNFEIELLEIA